MNAANNCENSNHTSYVLRPNFQKKFQPAKLRSLIHNKVLDILSDMYEYDSSVADEKAEKISHEIRKSLKELSLDGYKFIVETLIIERRCQGINIVSHNFWDLDTDNCISETIYGSNFICMVTALGIFHY
ncbi:Tctex1 domain-containing protein 2 [Trichinella pseudospiralis]|uniref:Tctex1 domain-containing protein 2 n=2 Tax=Trichinella TaxID=6333 RepID=A0A0V1IT58_TRIPS|nr:Tctex1 domain-containing protein 2 [Trichinella pseudospiralis]KRY68606.1 Tctex1 domain-containing protein 2 [Trichinella pseudospiralis]KRZ15046.1 Tctex1 domain-containing protein 2 [Trichinella zimbabwensis]KRZ25951.1 Tctex1 domain-containing protein 2 [Trichinella pseudospiralis]KRZ37231.1 Tctex1 domain-containing protein 2 [Trichinella pseudospiralis]